MQRIISDYFEQLYVSKTDNLDEVENFLEMCKLPRLSWNNQGEIENMNRLITSKKKIRQLKKGNLPVNKSLGPDNFTGEFYQTFREELIPILLKVFHKSAEEEILPNSFYEVSSKYLLLFIYTLLLGILWFACLWRAVWAPQAAQLVKNLPAVQEAWVQSLRWEDSLEKGVATHSSTLAWRIPRTAALSGFTKTETQLTRLPLRGLWIGLLTSWCSVLITPGKSVAFSALFCFPVIPDCDSFQPLLVHPLAHSF